MDDDTFIARSRVLPPSEGLTEMAKSVVDHIMPDAEGAKDSERTTTTTTGHGCSAAGRPEKTVERCCFAFEDDDLYAIIEAPDNISVQQHHSPSTLTAHDTETLCSYRLEEIEPGREKKCAVSATGRSPGHDSRCLVRPAELTETRRRNFLSQNYANLCGSIFGRLGTGYDDFQRLPPPPYRPWRDRS